MSETNRFVFVGQIARAVELRRTAGGKAVCDLRVTQRVRAPKVDRGFYQDSIEVTLWEQDAETAAPLGVGTWVEVTGKLGTSKQSLWDGDARQRANVWALKPALPNVRALDEEEICETTQDLVPIDADHNAGARYAPKATTQKEVRRATSDAKGVAAGYYGDPDADIPF